MPLSDISGPRSPESASTFSPNVNRLGTSRRNGSSDLSFLAQLARAVIHGLESRGALPSPFGRGGAATLSAEPLSQDHPAGSQAVTRPTVSQPTGIRNQSARGDVSADAAASLVRSKDPHALPSIPPVSLGATNPHQLPGGQADVASGPGPPRAARSLQVASLVGLRGPGQQLEPQLVQGGTVRSDVAPAIPFGVSDYPRPPGDSGRGVHWIPTLHSDPGVVDRFVAEAKTMNVSWVVFLNDGSNVGQNDYLVRQLVANHIEPVMRIYTTHGQPIDGDLTGMVRHYVDLGVHYFLPYNEPNLPDENPDGNVSVDGYVSRWTSAARKILDGGGLPGLGALAPGAPVDDVRFLRSTFEKIRQNGNAALLDRAWIGVHNYTFNRPIDYHDDSNGFLKFRWYDQVARQVLGRSLPIISTEGGPRLGDDQDHRYPAVDEKRRDFLATEAFHYLDNREPYFFAQTQWVLANQAGGGHDVAWEKDVLFQGDGSPTQLAQELRTQEVTA